MIKNHALAIIFLIISTQGVARLRHYSPFDDSGWIHIRGMMVNGTCSVTTNTRDMLIDLDKIASATNKPTHSVGPRNSFSLSVQGCDTVLSDNIGVIFSGKPVPFMPELLQTAMLRSPAVSPGSGIALFYDNDKKIFINGKPIDLTYFKQDSREIRFTATVVPLSQQYPDANMMSSVTLIMTYP